MSEFDLDKLYTRYLGMGGVTEEQMHPAQRLEMKRAFMAGCASMLEAFTIEIPQLPRHLAVSTVTNMRLQARKYWTEESKRHPSPPKPFTEA